MFKRIMLAGLMSATVLGGIVPAYAQERAPRGERGMRNGDGAAVSRGNRMNQPRGDAGRAAGTQPRAQPPATKVSNSAVPPPIWVMQPILPVAMISGFSASIFLTLRAFSFAEISGCMML